MLKSVYRNFLKFFKNDLHWASVAFFRCISIFHGLSTRQLGRVMQAMQRRSYRAGEVLFVEGQVGKAVFIIESGKVELSRKTPDGDIKSLGILGQGQIFGEMALLEQMERTASATVVEDGVIHFLYTASLESLIRRQPAIGFKLMKNIAIMLSALLRRTNKELDRKARAS